MDLINAAYNKHRKCLLGIAAVGLAAFVIGVFVLPERAWASLLVGNYYFLMIALYGVIFIALNYVLSSGWAVLFRRIPEAMAAYLPVGAVLMLVLVFGRSAIYPGLEKLHPGPHVGFKTAYLNPGFILARTVVTCAIWILFAYILRSHSTRQDADGDVRHTRKNQIRSAVFLMVCGVTFIFSSIDWVMSLEPNWYSTMFPVYCFAGLLLGGTAAMALFLLYMRARNIIPGITEHHVYELSRIICATSTFWAYIWFSQFMLIYYTNIGEETAYFALRLTGGWTILFLLNFALNWIVPLVILIPASSRRSPKWLLRAAVIVLVGRWLDVYLLVMPALKMPVRFGFVEILTFAGMMALFVFAFLRSFRVADPVPANDPYLIESAHFGE